MCVYKGEIYMYILLTSTFKYQRRSRMTGYYSYIDSYPLEAKIKN